MRNCAREDWEVGNDWTVMSITDFHFQSFSLKPYHMSHTACRLF